MEKTTRLLVAMSLAFGLGYPLLWGALVVPQAMIAAKGAGVGLLAIAAAFQARHSDGWLLAAVMALGALGDVLLEIDFAAGAIAFAVGHVVAIILYRRNRRAAAAHRLDRAIAILLPAAAMALSLFVLWGSPEAYAFAGYALLLGGMAAAAWTSRFSRLVALGALSFLASDMLIALRMAGEHQWLSLPIWLLYYVGQLMIFLGVISSLPAIAGGEGDHPQGGGGVAGTD